MLIKPESIIETKKRMASKDQVSQLLQRLEEISAKQDEYQKLFLATPMSCLGPGYDLKLHPVVRLCNAQT